MNLEMTPEEYSQKAMCLFRKGYNCSQSVLLAFDGVTGINEKTAAMLSSSFGGGMGRLREVCGAVSGMFMIYGLTNGYSDPKDKAAKAAHYASIQDLANEFKAQNGSIICRELLGLTEASSPTPAERTAEYYQKRPCELLVGDAAKIVAEYLAKK